MYFSVRSFRLYFFFSYLYALNNAQQDNQISTFLTDTTFVNDDVCSEIINEHSCVKNVLGVLVDFINSNLQKINELDRKFDILQLENKMLENKLKYISAATEKLEIKVSDLGSEHQPKESNYEPKSSFSMIDSLLWFLDTFNKLYIKMNNYPFSKMDNVSLDFETDIFDVGSEPNRGEKKVETKWYDSEAWMNFGTFLSGQFPNLYDTIMPLVLGKKESQVTSYGSESGRNFPEYQATDTHYKNKKENEEYSAENGNKISEYYENYHDSSPNTNSKPLDWKRFGDTIERQIDVFNVVDIVGLVTNFGQPIAALSTVIASGINFYHNQVQEDVLREHKNLIDGLRSDFDALNIPASSTADVTALTATVTDLEKKVVNIIDSMAQFCDSIESISQDLQGHISLAPGTGLGHTVNPIVSGQDTTESVTADDLIQCCVNSSNGKMNCIRKQALDSLAGQNIKVFSYSVPRLCDKCSTDFTNDPASCANYNAMFPSEDNLCNND